MCSTNKAAKPSLFGPKVKFQNLNAKCLPETKPDFKVSCIVNQYQWDLKPKSMSQCCQQPFTVITHPHHWPVIWFELVLGTQTCLLQGTLVSLQHSLAWCGSCLTAPWTAADRRRICLPLHGQLCCVCVFPTVCARFASAHVAVSHELCGAGFDEHKLTW